MRFLLFFIFISAAVNPAFSLDSAEVNRQIEIQAQKFKYILNTAYYNYYDSLKLEKASDKALKALLEGMDIQSRYYPSDEYQAIKENNTGEAFGPGIKIFIINDTSYVGSLTPGSPAEKAGVLTGDKIIYINGENVIGWDNLKMNNILHGEKDTDITLVVKRNGDLKEFIINREDTPVSGVQAAYLFPGTKTGVIKIKQFSFKSDKEFEEALNHLKSLGMENLLIDLRDNPGGAISNATGIASNFLSNTRLVTALDARNETFQQEFKTEKAGEFTDIPIIILLDEQSASASEILAAALQDYDRALLIGGRSFGKGSVQKIWEFKDGSAFRLTVAHYKSPLGRNIEKNEVQRQANSKDLKQLILELKQSDNINFKKSEGGRLLIEAGGIIPDFIVYNDTITVLSRTLIQRLIINEFIFNYLELNRQKLISDYDNNPLKFRDTYKVSDEMLLELKQLSYSKNIWNNEMFLEDKEYIRNFVKASIAHALWGEKEFYPIYAQFDKTILEALEKLPEAELLIKK